MSQRQDLLNAYEDLTPILLDEIRRLGRELEGLRVLHVNSTAKGGGVAEMLAWLIPALEEAGIQAEWHVLEGSDSFFHMTKKLHNALQGRNHPPSEEEWNAYFNQLADEARLIPRDAHIIIFHDPQTLGLAHFLPKENQAWAWRLHIDTTTADEETLQRVLTLIPPMDMLILTLPAYGIPFKPTRKPIRYIQPAIDAYSRKNRPLLEGEAEKILGRYGLTPGYALQVSRFDPWKGFDQVIEAWRMVRQRIPLQLVLVGSAADDDPEGQEVLEEVKRLVKDDPDVTIITEHDDLLVNVLQRHACCVYQLSQREGFGLTVTEAMWKEKPVIGGPAEGIRAQIKHGQTGFIARNPGEAAAYTLELFHDPALRERIGRAAHEHVRQQYLLPRLVRDHLLLYKELLTRREEARAQTV